MRKAVVLLLLLTLVCACSRGPDPVKALPGTWTVSEPAPLTFAFAAGGRFQAQAAGSPDFDEGTYSIEGDRIIFHHGPSARMQIDQAFRMKWEGKDTVTLTYLPQDAPADAKAEPVVFVLKRIGPAQQFPGKTVAQVVDPAQQRQRDGQQCLSNVKQIAMAMLMYSQDYDEMQVGNGWTDSLLPYVKAAAVFRCPEVARDGGPAGYAMNEEISGKPLSSVQNPASTAAVFDSTLEGSAPVGAWTAVPDPPRHPDGNSISYVDGHAKSVP